MGCAASFLQDDDVSRHHWQQQSSRSDHNNSDSRESSASVVQWKLFMSQEEAREKFLRDGTLLLESSSEPEYLDLRALLDDINAQGALGKFARSLKVLTPFMCWIDIQEYKSIPANTDSYRSSKAMHIYSKYIESSAPLHVGELLEPAELAAFNDIFEQCFSAESRFLLRGEMFDCLQYQCFLCIFEHIYLPFKQTAAFSALTRELKQRYNRVKLSHFEYFAMLGEGGFGFVVHCRKKSTGQHYAMKIQTKKALLHTFRENPWNANLEKKVFASCQHPFISSLAYAFQTESLALMVLELATGGDLNQCLLQSPERRLPQQRVCFYAAEIVLALSYLHQSGLVYRDLKPQNVLLAGDGHIRLVDLGGVMDEKGTKGNTKGDFNRSEQHMQKQLNRLPLLMLHSTYEAVSASVSAAAVDGDDDSAAAAVKHSLDQNNSSNNSNINNRAQPPPASDVAAASSNGSHSALSLQQQQQLKERSRNRSNQREFADSGSSGGVLKDKSIERLRRDLTSAEQQLPLALADEDQDGLQRVRELLASAPQQQQQPVAVNAVVAAASGEAAKVQIRRKFSVMGTAGYMAPEMLLLLLPRKDPNQPLGEVTKARRILGYSNAVDWWALGVSVFKLLTGNRPFSNNSNSNDSGSSDSGSDEHSQLVEMDADMRALLHENRSSADYCRLFQRINFPSYVSAEARDLIQQLLNVDEKLRLGAGRNGLRRLKKHAFFSDIDWELLEQKQVPPPFKPTAPAAAATGASGGEAAAVVGGVLDLEEEACFPYPDVATLLAVHGRGSWLEDPPPEDCQKYFEHWNFTSPHTIRVEAGMSQAMEQYDSNFKVRKLMGSPMSANAQFQNLNSSFKRPNQNPELLQLQLQLRPAERIVAALPPPQVAATAVEKKIKL